MGGECDESGDGNRGDGGCDAVQVEPMSSGAGWNAFNDAGGEGHEESGGEDGDGCRERRRFVNAAELADGANKKGGR